MSWGTHSHTASLLAGLCLPAGEGQLGVQPCWGCLAEETVSLWSWGNSWQCS